MPSVRLVPREEAQQVRQVREPGPRSRRRELFEELARPLLEDRDIGVIYEDLNESPQKFITSLRMTFLRHRVPVVVRKVRGKDMVKAYVDTVSSGRRGQPVHQEQPIVRRGRPQAHRNGRRARVA